jgi:hypothetical protein
VKTYLIVPFHEKAAVKALGGRFDMANQKWFVPDGLDLWEFKRWVPGAGGEWMRSGNPMGLTRRPQREHKRRARKG